MELKVPVSVTIPVQWGDQDLFGHVNNTHFLRWFESARIAYLIQCGLTMTNKGISPILAAIQCDYLRQVKCPDTVTIGATVEKIGNASLVMVHKVWSEAQHEVVAQGTSTVVIFDYVSQKPVRVPDPIRDAIERLEKSS